MADSNKSTVVIASVLKPVDDPRMCQKIGQTLAESGYDVHVIGMASPSPAHPGVTPHPLKYFPRLSPRRLLAPWRVLFITLRLRPRIFIITTHELLYVALIARLICRCRLIYDVQENYYWNILYTKAFPFLTRPFLALYVRGKEVVAAKFIDHFLLAERGYQQELKFPGTRYTVVENKVRIDPDQRKRPPFDNRKNTINLLFSGTLAESTGVFTAIDLAIKLHVIDNRIQLTIIGRCAQPAILKKIRLLIHPRPFIQLIASEAPVPYTEIRRHIQSSDFGMVTYQINPSTMNSIPTKLYEYMGWHLPILLVNHPPWVGFCQPYDAAVVFDPLQPDASAIHREMMNTHFFKTEPTEVYWEGEQGAGFGFKIPGSKFRV